MPEKEHKMKLEDGMAGRLFIVGSPRSGTTLLQAMLARHSRIFSLPETHFFLKAPAGGHRGRLGLASRKARGALLDILKELGREELSYKIPRRSPFMRAYARAFCEILDLVAMERGQDMWLEKTPRHLTRIDAIERLVPSARFIHIIRDGRDVVASLYEISSKYPEIAWGTQNLSERTENWNRYVQISLLKMNSPGHILAVYEDLVENPEQELARICDFLSVEFEAEMLNYWTTADQVVGRLASYPWMQKALRPLENTRLVKFSKIFTQEQQRFITERLIHGGNVSEALGREFSSHSVAR